MLRKNFPNDSVFDFDAESQSVTGPCWKNQVNIDPTRLSHSGTARCFGRSQHAIDQFTAHLVEARINFALAILNCFSMAQPAAIASGLPESVPA